MLRCEGLYSSHLTDWRRQLATLDASTPEPKRGRKPDQARPDNLRIDKLERALAHQRLTQAEAIIDAQKSCARCWDCRAVMSVLRALSARVGVVQACARLGLWRATVYGQRRPKTPAVATRIPPLKLDVAEQAIVLGELMSPRFVDRAPHPVYATLFDEGRYLCSIRTMYRLLASQWAVRERREQRVHPGRTPGLNCWPRHPINCGHGTSASSRPR